MDTPTGPASRKLQVKHASVCPGPPQAPLLVPQLASGASQLSLRRWLAAGDSATLLSPPQLAVALHISARRRRSSAHLSPPQAELNASHTLTQPAAGDSAALLSPPQLAASSAHLSPPQTELRTSQPAAGGAPCISLSPPQTTAPPLISARRSWPQAPRISARRTWSFAHLSPPQAELRASQPATGGAPHISGRRSHRSAPTGRSSRQLRMCWTAGAVARRQPRLPLRSQRGRRRRWRRRGWR